MKWNIVLGIMVVILVGTILGYYQPKIKSYEVRIATLESEKSSLQAEVVSLNQTVATQKVRISTQATQISTLESEKSKLQTDLSSAQVQMQAYKGQVTTLTSEVASQKAQIATLASEKSKLQTDLSSAQAQTQVYKGQVTTLTSELASSQGQVTTLTSQLSSSQKRLDKILDITVNQYYQWSYQGSSWQWELPIPLSVYVEYREALRPQAGPAWVNMAKDPKDDYYIDQMVQKITDAALRNRFTEVQKLNFVIAFVQSLPYTVDSVTTPYNEYPRYPIETLFDRGGDCEDTSILVAALLDRLGYDVALLLLKDARHMAVGVAVPNVYGSYYEEGGKKYFYLETTGDGWEIGEFPSNITNTKAYVYPLRS